MAAPSIESVPPRHVGSIRRTSSIDVVRPAGITSPTVFMSGRCRDVVTTDTGGEVVAAVELALTIAVAGAIIQAISSTTGVDLEPLVGRSAMSKFRAGLAEVTPDEVTGRTALHRLLDDVPGANLVSGYAYAIAGIDTRRSAQGIESRADLCAGWINDGEMMRNARAGDLGLRLGPPAPVVELAGDPLGFHELPPLPEHSFRRHRRMDVIPAGDAIRLDGFFRDVYFSADGPTSIHEYGYAAELDGDLVVRAIDVTPGTLPWDECPGAAVSASWLVGERVGSIDSLVRSRFKGVHTCTHLNDALRTLDDVAALRDALASSAD
jgi:hypothetical protein